MSATAVQLHVATWTADFCQDGVFGMARLRPDPVCPKRVNQIKNRRSESENQRAFWTYSRLKTGPRPLPSSELRTSPNRQAHISLEFLHIYEAPTLTRERGLC